LIYQGGTAELPLRDWSITFKSRSTMTSAPRGQARAFFHRSGVNSWRKASRIWAGLLNNGLRFNLKGLRIGAEEGT
jgi:hypothetical protein